jgi:lactate permease
VICGAAVIVAMAVYLKATQGRLFDKSQLDPEELEYEHKYSLFIALTPWLLLVALILALNLPKVSFDFLYRTMRMPINGLSPDGKPLDTRLLWQAYTWIFISTFLSAVFIRPTGAQIKETFAVWFKRAPRPVFSAAIFFAIGEVMNMSGYSMAAKDFTTPSMVNVLANTSADFFHNAYGAVVAFIGLFGGFLSGSEASTVAMFGKYTLTTADTLGMPIDGLILITAGLAFGGGLASVISPAKLQNAAAAIDRIGEESKVIRIALVFSIILTAVTSAFLVSLLYFRGIVTV